MADRPLSVAVSTDSLARAANVPLPADDGLSLHKPSLPFLAEGSATESSRNSYVQPTPFDSGTLLPMTKNEDFTGEGEEDPAPPPPSPQKAKRRPLLLILVGLVALIVVVLGVMLPVYFVVIKPRNATSSQPTASGTNSTGGTGGGGTSQPPPSSTDAITGGDGSTVKANDGTTFTYNNKLGGICELIPS